MGNKVGGIQEPGATEGYGRQGGRVVWHVPGWEWEWSLYKARGCPRQGNTNTWGGGSRHNNPPGHSGKLGMGWVMWEGKGKVKIVVGCWVGVTEGHTNQTTNTTSINKIKCNNGMSHITRHVR